MNDSSHNTNSPFKQCPMCGYVCETREDFLADPSVEIIGYQVHFDELKEGLFLFNHSCGTTCATKAGEFKDLYKGPIFKERKTGTDECPEYCLNECDLRRCPAQCECAYVREIIQIIKEWPKKSDRSVKRSQE